MTTEMMTRIEELGRRRANLSEIELNKFMSGETRNVGHAKMYLDLSHKLLPELLRAWRQEKQTASMLNTVIGDYEKERQENEKLKELLQKTSDR